MRIIIYGISEYPYVRRRCYFSHLKHTDVSDDEILTYSNLFTLPSVNYYRKIKCIIKGDVLDMDCVRKEADDATVSIFRTML